MSAPTRQQAPPVQAMTTEQASALLDQVIANTSQSRQVLDSWFGQHSDKIKDLLPDCMKGQANRLIKRAMLTFSRSERLQKCTPASFVQCVLGAAELGLAIDGRLCHAVPYKNTAQLIPDYKGIIAVAKRTKVIKDCYADIVCENDIFSARREDGKCHLTHEIPSFALQDRGKPLCGYAIIILPDSEWRYELMSMKDLDAIRARSKSWQAGGGPWATDDFEMRKKTVLKRALKTYCEDPAIVRALEIDDDDYELTEPRREPVPMPRAIGEGLPQTTNGDEAHEHDEPPNELAPPDQNEPPADIDYGEMEAEGERITKLIAEAKTMEDFDFVDAQISDGAKKFDVNWVSILTERNRKAREEAAKKKPATAAKGGRKNLPFGS